MGSRSNTVRVHSQIKKIHKNGTVAESYGRDALRKRHSALFLAKARAEAMLQAFEPLGSNPVSAK